MFVDIPRVTSVQAAEYWANLPTELSWGGVALVVIGAVALLVRRWRVGLLLLTALIVQLFFFFNYEIWDLYVFYIPSYVLLALLAIPGIGALADLGTQTRWVNYGVEIAVALLVLVFALWPVFRPQKDAVIAGEVPFNSDEYPVFDENLQNFASAAVLKMPEKAIIFTDWDMVWPYYYVAHIQERRRDLTFVETYPADDVDSVAVSVVDYVAMNLADHPIFFGEREQALLKAGFDFTPARLGPARLFRVIANE